ncbi:hypothetical protein IGI66_000200 [Enterococcus sp. AZ048]|uniref:hypothetical protein n=1 Tax=Enterococcus sp. AZ048 TaxID=2774658 RepID=UPI003F23F6B3
MELINIDGKQTEYLSIYNSSDQNIVIYISSNDRRDYTQDMQDLIQANKHSGLTIDKILEGLDVAVLIEKDESIEQFRMLINQIEGWKTNENQ